MSLTYGQASGLPPGMIDGPWRAPSSPPDTPVPTNRMPFLGQLLGAAVGIRVQGVAAINDDVAFFQIGNEMLDGLIDDACPP